jgi:hypothetical protein
MILLSDVPSEEEAGDSQLALAHLLTCLSRSPLSVSLAPLISVCWASDLSHGRTRSIWSRLSAAEAGSREACQRLLADLCGCTS